MLLLVLVELLFPPTFSNATVLLPIVVPFRVAWEVGIIREPDDLSVDCPNRGTIPAIIVIDLTVPMPFKGRVE